MTNTTTSHRLVNLRRYSAGCSCGAAYEGDGAADLRAQHKAHKANPPPIRKATARKGAPKTTAKPRKAAK